MAGQSLRFAEAGYTLPKYMLQLAGRTLFEHSVSSFRKYFQTERFLFIALGSGFDEARFIIETAGRLGIDRMDTVVLDRPTRGQAETVFLGLARANIPDQPIAIFNIDTFRPGFSFPDHFYGEKIDGYLETFIGSGANWSNVVPAGNGGRVASTAEKQNLSKFCCTGLYYWASSGKFCDYFRETATIPVQEIQGHEYYIAPMYNRLIADKGDVRFTVVDKNDVVFCGTPDEYEALLA